MGDRSLHAHRCLRHPDDVAVDRLEASSQELALLRLGISVRTPEDVARALRDNAALIDLGFTARSGLLLIYGALTPRAAPRRSRTPSRWACSAMSIELPAARMIFWISSVIGMTW